jgi:hypothetical protein
MVAARFLPRSSVQACWTRPTLTVEFMVPMVACSVADFIPLLDC